MYSVEEFIIEVFCLVDDGVKDLTNGLRLRHRGFAPALSDSEVITLEIVGEFLGKDADTASPSAPSSASASVTRSSATP